MKNLFGAIIIALLTTLAGATNVLAAIGQRGTATTATTANTRLTISNPDNSVVQGDVIVVSISNPGENNNSATAKHE